MENKRCGLFYCARLKTNMCCCFCEKKGKNPCKNKNDICKHAIDYPMVHQNLMMVQCSQEKEKACEKC